MEAVKEIIGDTAGSIYVAPTTTCFGHDSQCFEHRGHIHRGGWQGRICAAVGPDRSSQVAGRVGGGDEEIAQLLCSREQGRLLQGHRSGGPCSGRVRVPLGEYFRVETGPHSLCAVSQESVADSLHLGWSRQVAAYGAVQDVGTLEIAAFGQSIPTRRGLEFGCVEHLGDLSIRPYVELALFALGVGILGCAISALGCGQVALDVRDRLANHLPQHGAASVAQTFRRCGGE